MSSGDAYLAILIPLVFAGLVFYLVILRNRFAKQKVYLEKMSRILERQSMIDEVTGVVNRRYLDFEIEREIERARRFKHPLGGLMVDVDDFKQVNDRYGHLTGDVVLAQVASVLRQSVRKIDIVGRYGGDEFIVILPEATVEGAKVVASRIQKNIRVFSIEPPIPQLAVTLSMGLFSFPEASGLDRNLFIEKVDLAMLKAKQAGKNRIVSG